VKEETKSMKLKVEFSYPEHVIDGSSSSRSQIKSVSENVAALRNRMHVSESNGIRPLDSSGSPDVVFSELQALRKKYDDVIAYTVHLTAERDNLIAQNDENRRELNREIARRKNGDILKVGKSEKEVDTKKVVQQVRK